MKSYHQLILNDSNLNSTTKMIMIGTKKDLSDSIGHTEIENLFQSDIDKFISFYEYKYLETSSKNSFNITKAFEMMLQEIYFQIPKNDLKMFKLLNKKKKLIDISFGFQ